MFKRAYINNIVIFWFPVYNDIKFTVVARSEIFFFRKARLKVHRIKPLEEIEILVVCFSVYSHETAPRRLCSSSQTQEQLFGSCGQEESKRRKFIRHEHSSNFHLALDSAPDFRGACWSWRLQEKIKGPLILSWCLLIKRKLTPDASPA